MLVQSVWRTLYCVSVHIFCSF